jgi:hypothetical protein
VSTTVYFYDSKTVKTIPIPLIVEANEGLGRLVHAFDEAYNGESRYFILYPNTPPKHTENPVCLLDSCEILMADSTYKNISQISNNDKIMGCFSMSPCIISSIVKNTHQIKTIEASNHPFLIRKNSFGSVPTNDIHLSGHHRIIVKKRDGTFLGVQTFKFENTVEKVIIDDQEFVTYYNISLVDRNEGIIVNGLAVESYQL